MIIGSHVSYGKEGLLGSAKEAVSYGANTFMFYTGAPQNTIRKLIDPQLTIEAKEYMKSHDIDIQNVICHAPYIINLANRDEIKWEFSKSFLGQELKRCDELGVCYLVLHPGSSLQYSKEEALQNIVDALNEVLEVPHQVLILIETMAGKGTECGTTIDEIKYILTHVRYSLGVCLDTCHLNDAGYNMSQFQAYLELFNKEIGLDKVRCIHLNDSKNPFGSHKDRHANIGYGTIGFEDLLNICRNDQLKEIPKILETPYVGETWEDKNRLYPPYRFEIEELRMGIFDSNLLEHIKTYYKNL